MARIVMALAMVEDEERRGRSWWMAARRTIPLMVYSLGAELSVMGAIESDQNVGGGNCQARLSDQTDGILAFTSLRLIFEG